MKNRSLSETIRRAPSWDEVEAAFMAWLKLREADFDAVASKINLATKKPHMAATLLSESRESMTNFHYRFFPALKNAVHAICDEAGKAVD